MIIIDILKDILGEKELPMSIPNGYASKTIMEEVIKCGFTNIYTSQPTTKTKLFQKHNVIGHYVVHDNMTTDDVLRIVNSKGYRLKLSLKWHALNLMKGVLGGVV